MKGITFYTANEIDLRPNLDIVTIHHENITINLPQPIEAEKGRVQFDEIFVWIGIGKGFVLKNVSWKGKHLTAKISDHNLSILLGLVSNKITSL